MIQTLEDDEYVKVIDFGVAKVRNSVVDVVTSKDVAVGTIAYMSPEQLSAQPVVPQSDVYAMGVIAYEMLTGKRPTNPESAFQLLELQRSGVRVKPSDLRPGLSADAEKIILRALSFEPQNRYERARDFGDLLSSALVGDKDQTQLATEGSSEAARSEKTLGRELLRSAIMIILAPVLSCGVGSPQPTVSENIVKTVAPAPAAPERSFTYWLTYQKMRAGKPDSELRQSAGNDIFGNGGDFNSTSLQMNRARFTF
jgi:serine/threonine protein kinase